MRYTEIAIPEELRDTLERYTNELSGLQQIIPLLNNKDTCQFYIEKFLNLNNEYEILKRQVTDKFISPILTKKEQAVWNLNFTNSMLEVQINENKN